MMGIVLSFVIRSLMMSDASLNTKPMNVLVLSHNLMVELNTYQFYTNQNRKSETDPSNIGWGILI